MSEVRITIPERVNSIIKTLEDAGYEAYAVGGCIRDIILGRKPQDWDITTSALPQQVKSLFRRTVDTGIKHGTVTVMIGDEGFEVTTYRVDGIYEDGSPEQIFDNPKGELTRRFIKKLKLLELEIDSTEFDFALASGEIDKYCLQNDVPPRTKYRIRLAFEELVQQLLLPVLKRTAVHVTVEYSPVEMQTRVTASYGGERFDPAEGGNDLSYNVLKSSVEDLSYEYDLNEEKSNIVNLVII